MPVAANNGTDMMAKIKGHPTLPPLTGMCPD